MINIRCTLRTQVYLPQELRQHIDILAKKEKKPAARVIRELLTVGIDTRQRETIDHALARLANLPAKGSADLSANLDKYLYK